MKNKSTTDHDLNRNVSSSYTVNLSSKAEVIALCSAFALEAGFIVAGNLLTIVLFSVYKKLRKKSLFLVIKMAFADLMLGAMSIPLRIYLFSVHSYLLWRAERHTFLLISCYVCGTVSLQASLNSAALISVERFYTIYWPLKHRTLTMRAYRIVIFITVWALAIVLSTAFFFVSDILTLNIFNIASVSILLFIVCTCNIGIWRKF